MRDFVRADYAKSRAQGELQSTYTVGEHGEHTVERTYDGNEYIVHSRDADGNPDVVSRVTGLKDSNRSIEDEANRTLGRE